MLNRPNPPNGGTPHPTVEDNHLLAERKGSGSPRRTLIRQLINALHQPKFHAFCSNGILATSLPAFSPNNSVTLDTEMFRREYKQTSQAIPRHYTGIAERSTPMLLEPGDEYRWSTD
jgi:hypothetical protein